MKKKNNKKRNKTTALVVLFIILFIFCLKFNNIAVEGNKDDNDKLKISALTPHIYIDDLGGGDYTWEEAVVQDWCSGSGTNVDPYLLENLIIDGGGTYDCIRIVNSKAYFTIRNCTVYNGDGSINAGIVLNNVTNGKVIENNCTMNNWYGIYFDECRNNIISDNLLSLHQYHAIVGIDSNYTTISSNEIFDNGWSGIYLEDCSNNEISNNDIYKSTSRYGIRLVHSPSHTISGNEIERARGGIDIFESNDTIISNNIVKNNERYGIFMTYSFNNDVSGNTFKNNSVSGIVLKGSSSNTISNNIAYNNSEHGISLEPENSDHSNGNLITNNICDNNTLCGIFLYNASKNQILNNMIINNQYYGAFLTPDSVDNLFSENKFLKNYIHAESWEVNTDWNTTSIGNYWDNYTGTDANNDGIGDTPYDIIGTGGNKDYLPIWDERAPIINITSPVNNSKIGREVPDIKVEIYDPNLDTMWYSIDEGITNITFTSNVTISQTSWETLWDSLAKGDNITIIVYANDTFSHLGSNYVVLIKHVSKGIIGLDFSITAILISITSGIAIVGIIAKIHSKKRIII